MTETSHLFLVQGGGASASPRPLDGYWLNKELLHAECFPTGVSAAGRTPAERENAPEICEACGELVRYESDYLDVRRDVDGTIYTMLDNTTDRAWTKGARGWEAKQVEVSIDETMACAMSEVPDALRREISVIYAGLHEYLPAQLLHFRSPVFSNQRVKLTCPTCGGNGRRDQSNLQLGDNHCETCSGSGRVDCKCEECDERAAGKR